MIETTAVRSIRMKVELWAFVLERSKLKGLTVNGWVTRMIELEREHQKEKAVAVGPRSVVPGSRLKAKK